MTSPGSTARSAADAARPGPGFAPRPAPLLVARLAAAVWLAAYLSLVALAAWLEHGPPRSDGVVVRASELARAPIALALQGPLVALFVAGIVRARLRWMMIVDGVLMAVLAGLWIATVWLDLSFKGLSNYVDFPMERGIPALLNAVLAISLMVTAVAGLLGATRQTTEDADAAPRMVSDA